MARPGAVCRRGSVFLVSGVPPLPGGSLGPWARLQVITGRQVVLSTRSEAVPRSAIRSTAPRSGRRSAGACCTTKTPRSVARGRATSCGLRTAARTKWCRNGKTRTRRRKRAKGTKGLTFKVTPLPQSTHTRLAPATRAALAWPLATEHVIAPIQRIPGLGPLDAGPRTRRMHR